MAKTRMQRAAVLALLAATTVAAAMRECEVSELRPFLSGPVARECARETRASSSFELLRAPPNDERMLEICRSGACRKLFSGEADAVSTGDCTVPLGDRIRLYADLVDHVRSRCVGFKDAYALVDCAVIGTSGTTSEFWYFPDSANASAVPVDAKRWVVSASDAVAWEGDEVAVSTNGMDLFAYIEETGRSERVGDFAGLLEAGRSGATTAFECRRADDSAFPTTGGKRCERRYMCYSE